MVNSTDKSNTSLKGTRNGEVTPVVELPDDDRRVESVTEALNVIQSSNGRPVFSIVADEHVDFIDGWNVWEQVELVLFGERGRTRRGARDANRLVVRAAIAVGHTALVAVAVARRGGGPAMVGATAWRRVRGLHRRMAQGP